MRWVKAVLCTLAGLSIVGTGGVLAAEAQDSSPPEAVRVAEALGEAIRWANARVAPSVVGITVETEAEPGEALGPVTPYGDMPGPQHGRALPFEQHNGGTRAGIIPDAAEPRTTLRLRPGMEPVVLKRRLGSGIVVDPAGFILTCAHLVAGAQRIAVQLSDGRSFEGTAAGSDPYTGLAVVKIEATDLHAAPFGDSDNLYVGQPVLAVGNPPNLPNTVTFGVVCGLHRVIGQAQHEDLIQTEAGVAQGSAGGPLVNMRGEVVGITSVVRPAEGQGVGVSFAIPAGTVKGVIDDLIAGRQVARGYLGIALNDLPPDMAEARGLKGKGGVLVAQVAADSPAEKAGLEAGDIIFQFNGHAIRDSRELQRLVTAVQPGSKVTVVIWRAVPQGSPLPTEGTQKEIAVELGRLLAP